MKHIRLKPYPVVLHVKFTDKNLKENDLAATYDSEQGHVLVVFRPKSLLENTSTEYLSTVVHESVHVVQMLQNYINHPLDMESQAYLTEEVFSCLKAECESFIGRRRGAGEVKAGGVSEKKSRGRS